MMKDTFIDIMEEIECWGIGGAGSGQCDAVFPGGSQEEYAAAGWGFTLDPNDKNAQAYYACPDCKDDHT